MSAVAVPPQQSQPAPSSLNTPGFFTQAFLELNVFEQCFSSLQAESSTPPTSSAPSTSSSNQKMNNPTGNPNPPSPRSIGRQNGGNEYSTPLGPALSLPSPIMHERKLYPVQQHQNNMAPSPMYQVVDRRYSLQEAPFNNSSMQPQQPSLVNYHTNRRFSHQQPLTSSFTTSSSVSPWVGGMIGHEEASFGGDQHQPTTSPQLQQYYHANPTPPNSTNSNSPIDKFNTDGPLQSQLSPVDNLSPLDTLINDRAEGVNGQTTPPEESSAFFDGPGPSDTGIRGGSGFQVPPSLQAQVQSQVSAPPETPKTNTRAKRGSVKGGSSSARKPKKNNTEPPPVELENDVHDAKRKRFLERNRVAASKCRQKKKVWMQDLELSARTAQNSSKHLTGMVSYLREEVLQLKGMLLKHSGCNCAQISTYLLNEAAKVANGAKQSMESMENAKSSGSQAATSFQLNPPEADLSQMDHSQIRYSSSSINGDENPFGDNMLDEGMDDFENELELRNPRGHSSP